MDIPRCKASRYVPSTVHRPNPNQINRINRGFNKHRLPTKYVSNFDQRSWLLFSPKEEATHAYDVVNKLNIIKPEWKRKGPLVFSYALVMQTLYFSQFFTSFFGGLHVIYSPSNVRLVHCL